MPRSSIAWPVVVARGLAVLVYSPLVRADDLFEIDVFHARVDQVGQFGLELHSNYVASGTATRIPPELSPDHVLYEMLEPSYGFSPGLEFGAHIQAALRPDGAIESSGLKVRVMGIVPTPSTFPLALAVNVEGGYIPRTYDPRTTVLEVRPVAELREGGFDVDINPIVSIATRGNRPGTPSFEPAAAVRYRVAEMIDVGVELYASLGPVSSLLPEARQGDYVFETLDLVRWAAWNVHAGLGEGLTSSSNALTITTIVAHYF